MTLAPRESEEERHWTIEDYRSLDDEERYEVLEGRLIMVPAPTMPHQQVITELGTLINGYVRDTGAGICFHAPFDVYLSKDTVVQPDFSFVTEERREEVLRHHGAIGAPDLVIEVLSPSTASRDRGEKRSIYAQAGVNWLLLVDPEGLTVEVFRLDEAGRYTWMDTASGVQTLTFGLFPELSIDLQKIWPEERLEEWKEEVSEGEEKEEGDKE